MNYSTVPIALQKNPLVIKGLGGRGAGARTQNKGFGDLRDTVSLHP